MIRCEVIEQFTLKDFYKLNNIKRKSIDVKGTLFIGDTFECNKEMCDYLMGKNEQGKVVVKAIEVVPEQKAIIEVDSMAKEIFNETPIIKEKSKKKKSSKK